MKKIYCKLFLFFIFIINLNSLSPKTFFHVTGISNRRELAYGQLTVDGNNSGKRALKIDKFNQIYKKEKTQKNDIINRTKPKLIEINKVYFSEKNPDTNYQDYYNSQAGKYKNPTKKGENAFLFPYTIQEYKDNSNKTQKAIFVLVAFNPTRTDRTKRRGLWEFLGGMTEKDETFFSAAVREFNEETANSFNELDWQKDLGSDGYYKNKNNRKTYEINLLNSLKGINKKSPKFSFIRHKGKSALLVSKAPFIPAKKIKDKGDSIIKNIPLTRNSSGIEQADYKWILLDDLYSFINSIKDIKKLKPKDLEFRFRYLEKALIKQDIDFQFSFTSAYMLCEKDNWQSFYNAYNILKNNLSEKRAEPKPSSSIFNDIKNKLDSLGQLIDSIWKKIGKLFKK